MTSQGHKKHADIARPSIGKFGRHELAILGAPCSVIHDLVAKLSTILESLTLTYIDADHQESTPAIYHRLTDKIGFHSMESTAPYNDFDQKNIIE